jgi:hypothetical protein
LLPILLPNSKNTLFIWQRYFAYSIIIYLHTPTIKNETIL